MNDNNPVGSNPMKPISDPMAGTNPLTNQNLNSPPPQSLRESLMPNPSSPQGVASPPPLPMSSAQSVQQPPRPIGPPLTNKPPVTQSTNVGTPPMGPTAPPPNVSNESADVSSSKNKMKFVKLGAIFLVIVAILVGVVFFLRTRGGTVSSYEECAQQADSVIQDTFPEVCVTKDGEYFERELSEEESAEATETGDTSGVDTSDWLTYVNAIYGYQMKYPADYTFEQITPEFSSLVMRDPASNAEPVEGVSLSLQVFALSGKSVESVVDEAISQTQTSGVATIVSAKQPASVGDLPGYTYTGQAETTLKYYYVALGDGENYLVIIDSSSDPNGMGYLDVVDEIVAGFTFTGDVAQEVDVEGSGFDEGSSEAFGDEFVCGGEDEIECPANYSCYYYTEDAGSEGECIED